MKIKALKSAFPYTIPVLTGYLVLGMAYGILMNEKGYSNLTIALISIFVFAGSMQFVSVGMLGVGFDPLSAFFMTLMVNARHIFYGISMLQKYKKMGAIKPYLIFGMTDETFSILCTTEPPKGVERKWFLFFVTLMDHFYWVTGSILGGIAGSLIQFETKGIEFVLTALFTVIFINQWQETKNHIPVMIGLLSTILCRILFGPQKFIIAAMVCIITCVTLLKRTIEKRNQI